MRTEGYDLPAVGEVVCVHVEGEVIALRGVAGYWRCHHTTEGGSGDTPRRKGMSRGARRTALH